MNKIRIELDSDEYINLLNLVQKEVKELPEPNIYSSIAKKLIDSLNSSLKENEIQTQVKTTIVRLIGGSVEQISNTQKLTKDLHLETLQIRSLATSFTAIAKKYKLEASINSDECEKLVTVQDCIDLIMGKTK